MTSPRQVLAALLGMLVAFQPIGATSPQCTIAGLMTGRGVCCCAEPEKPSCCSTAEERERSEDVSVEAEGQLCDCEMDVPAPLTALPHDAAVREESRSSLSMIDWVDQGAHASALTPILSTASPPPDPGLIPFGTATTALGFERGARGLLAVTCVARC
ncbi:MAG: hypothetical protein ACKVXR_10910 [Planctomycetota bacterium]